MAVVLSSLQSIKNYEKVIMAVIDVKGLFENTPITPDKKTIYRYSKRQKNNVNVETWSSQNPSTLHAMRVTRYTLMDHERWLVESSHEVERFHEENLELHSNHKEFLKALLKSLAYTGQHLGLGLVEDLDLRKEVTE